MAGSPDLPPLRDVIARHGLQARKGLGQHFLLDNNLTNRIAAQVIEIDAATVLEIGPGPGGLTRSLLAAGAGRVVAIERDQRCIAALADLAAAYPDRLEIVHGDALTLAHGSLVPAGTTVVANLPYNIATPLLFRWLDDPGWIRDMVLMFQREVAERLAAEPRTKAYGRLSVMAQRACQITPLFDVHPRAFTPPPKVWSQVVRLTPKQPVPPPAHWARLSRVVAAAFGQRRKMLRTTLKPVFDHPEAALTAAGIAPTARAEELTVADFDRLASADQG